MQHQRAGSCILQITDPHLFANASGRLAAVDTLASLEAVLDQALAEQTPDLLLVTGDLVQTPHRDSYTTLRRSIEKRYSGALLCLPGNHDEPELDTELFSCVSWVGGNWQVLALDSSVPGEERGEISAVELQRLEQQLAVTTEPHILVAVHHPPLELGFNLDPGRIRNGGELLELLAEDGRVRGIVYGHVHQAAYAEIGSMALYATPSTSVQFQPLSRRFALDTQAPGYRWLQLSEAGQIDTRVGRLPRGSFPALHKS